MTDSADPAPPQSTPRRHRRAVRRGGETQDQVTPQRSTDDGDTGWGERPADSNDERLLRDVPPHW
ncbi:hypothetical protein [Cellulomonas sp. NPDC089187]|uniref:hypothetical protein n=1 Tax=Cellulomonas sp. NPDC089187 TaxID=3154970 RepID=UPI00342E341D